MRIPKWRHLNDIGRAINKYSLDMSRHDVYNFNSHIMIAEFHSNRFQTNKLVYSKPGSWVQPVWKTWVKHKHGKTVIPEPGSLLLM